MAPRFNYQQRSPESIAKRASGNNWIGWAKDEFTTYKVRKENHIRILPPTWANPQHYGLDLWLHYSVGPQKGTIICLWKMAGQACPVCEAHARAEASGRPDANELKPTRRVVVWMIDRNFEKEKGEVKAFLWDMPATKVDTEIAIICKDRETGQLFYIDDPEHGYDVFFNKEGEKLQTDYKGFTLSRRESSVDQRYIDYIVANPIPNTLQWRTYEEVKAIFEGAGIGPVQSPTPAGAVAEVAAPVVTAPPPPFVPEWTGTHCSAPGCGQPQFTTPSGWTCGNGHGGAPSIEELTPPPQVTMPPAPVAPPQPPAPPVQVAPPQPAVAPAQPVSYPPAPVAAPPAPAVAVAPPPVVNAPPPAIHMPAITLTPAQAAPVTTLPAPMPAAPAVPPPAAPAPAANSVSSLRARFQTGK